MSLTPLQTAAAAAAAKPRQLVPLTRPYTYHNHRALGRRAGMLPWDDIHRGRKTEVYFQRSIERGRGLEREKLGSLVGRGEREERLCEWERESRVRRPSC